MAAEGAWPTPMPGVMLAAFTFANLLAGKPHSIPHHRRHCRPPERVAQSLLGVQQAGVFRQVVGVQRADHDAADAWVGGYGRQVGGAALAAVESFLY